VATTYDNVIVNADRSDLFAETWRGAAPKGMRARRLVGALLAAGVLAAGCGAPDKADPQGKLAVCVGPTAGLKAGDRVEIEFRQRGVRVASASIQVGAAFEAPVPAGAETEAYADGRLVGSSGPGDTAYLRGEGCPKTPAG
jgi:hypothetical protein